MKRFPMDPPLNDFLFDSGGEDLHPRSDRDPNFTLEFPFNDDSLDFNLLNHALPPPAQPAPALPPPLASVSVASAPDDDFSDTVSKFIQELLMEEDFESRPCMFHDPLALQAAEKSFSDLIGQDHTSNHDHSSLGVDGPRDSPGSGNVNDPRHDEPYSLQTSTRVFNFSSQMSFAHPDSSGGVFNPSAHSSVSSSLVPDILTGSDSVSLFRRGLEEANKFLPRENLLLANMERCKLPLQSKAAEENESGYELSDSRGRKNHHREDGVMEEGRVSKQSALSVDEEEELLEMFDKVLLGPLGGTSLECWFSENELGKPLQANEQASEQSPGLENGKRMPGGAGSKKEVVDLRTQLILCAQTTNADDRRTAGELLKQIRRHCSPFGDGSQRVAHYFANALDARLSGTGAQIYTSSGSKISSAAGMLKAYQLYLSASPFKKIAVHFANHHILKLAEKSATLHIIDFGIRYGFQWPIFIKHLSFRRGALTKLRITGIELPQPGFRPSESVEQTGQRLASFCERFNIPFEYNAIAQRWETIRIEDLRINRNEAIAVNCFFRLENLLDETVVVGSPRDAVLRLIREINPDIFTHALVNGAYNSPYFITRFKEALFHFSALFDMFDDRLSCEDPDRITFESGFYGRQIMNVIACEGSERVVRPEAYKQWQALIGRVGFKQLPLDEYLLMKLKCKAGTGYPVHFEVTKDDKWMLQGWKGRILNASTCWVPVRDPGFE